MSSPRIRRSTRQSKPSARAKLLFEQKQNERPFFPAERDEICVKWSLGGEIIWWPATVTIITAVNDTKGEVFADVLYRKFGAYDAEEASVVFSSSSTKERHVRSVDDTQAKNVASWIFADEPHSQEEEDEEKEGRSGNDKSSSSSQTTVNRPSSSSTRKPERSNIRSELRRLAIPSEVTLNLHGLSGKVGNKRTSGREGNSPINHPRHSPISKVARNRSSRYTGMKKRLLESKRKPTSSGAGEDQLSSGTSIVEEDIEDGENANGPNQGKRNNRVSNGTVSNEEHAELLARLRLVERQMMNVSNINHPSTSSSLNSVIVSLRWALLRALEKPLKKLHLPDLEKHGLACHEMTVTAQCDYYTFRELAKLLANEHRCLSEESNQDRRRESRIAFSPCYNTTQSGSSAANNMNIAFSCLADVTSLLRIRDDNDFESIVSKEVVSDSSTLLGIMGTFSIHKDNDILQPSTALTSSISATSEATSTIRLFIGSAPVDYEEQPNGVAESSVRKSLVGPSFRSSVLQQECRHFCSIQNCYRTPWVIKHVNSTLSVRCTSDLDGMIPSNQLRNYFILNWSRQATPSSVKWTRDIHDAGNNCPGQLRLSVPFIYFAANRNVRAIVSILDNHIETFMRVRSTLHNRSSFK